MGGGGPGRGDWGGAGSYGGGGMRGDLVGCWAGGGYMPPGQALVNHRLPLPYLPLPHPTANPDLCGELVRPCQP